MRPNSHLKILLAGNDCANWVYLSEMNCVNLYLEQNFEHRK